MTLSAQEKLDLLKHLGRSQEDTEIDQVLYVIAQNATKESELKTAISDANTALSAITNAENDSGKIESGGGAVFNYAERIRIRERTYKRYVADLIRITRHPNLDRGGSGRLPGTVGWQIGV